MVSGMKKSDEAVLPVKAANKGAQAPAEPPEGRASTPTTARTLEVTFCVRGVIGAPCGVPFRSRRARFVRRRPPCPSSSVAEREVLTGIKLEISILTSQYAEI